VAVPLDLQGIALIFWRFGCAAAVAAFDKKELARPDQIP